MTQAEYDKMLKEVKECAKGSAELQRLLRIGIKRLEDKLGNMEKYL